MKKYLRVFSVLVALVVFMPAKAHAECGAQSITQSILMFAVDIVCTVGGCSDILDTLDKFCEEITIMQAGMDELSEFGAIITPELYTSGTQTNVTGGGSFWGFTWTQQTITETISMGQAVNAQFLDLGNYVSDLQSDLEGATTDSEAFAIRDAFEDDVGDMLGDALHEAEDINDRIVSVQNQICLSYPGSPSPSFCYDL